MRKLLFISIILSSLTAFGQKRYDYYNSDIKKQKGIMKVTKNGEPLTGVVFGKYKNDQLEFEEAYVNGIKNGIDRCWFKNGKLMWEGNYKDGKLDGVWKDWDKQGNLIKETTYKDGKKTN